MAAPPYPKLTLSMSPVLVFVAMLVPIAFSICLARRAEAKDLTEAKHLTKAVTKQFTKQQGDVHSKAASADQGRRVQFPAAFSLGILHSCSDINSVEDHPPSQALGPARGLVVLPQNSFVTLVITKDGCRHSAWLKKLPPHSIQRLILNMVSLEDDEDGMSDQVLADASALEGLKELTLTGSDCTDLGMAHFAGSRTLTTLQIRSTQIAGKCFANFSSLKTLIVLNMGSNSMPIENLKFLSKLQSIRSLEFDCSRVTDQGVAYLGPCKELVELNLTHNPAITDKSIPILAGLKKLLVLKLSGVSISVKGLAGLKGLPLRVLDLPKSTYTRSEMQEIRKIFPQAAISIDSAAGSKSVPKEINQLYAPLH